MKKSIWLSALLSASLLAGNIEFKHAPVHPEHKLPNNTNEILSFNSILKKSMDAVVNISTKTITQNQQGQYRIFNDPFFQEFFGHRGSEENQSPVQEKQDHSLGSGVIVSKDGYIVTNYHVVADADEIVVTINSSGQEYKAKLIGVDRGSDLAVIKIKAKGLKPIAISNGDDIKLGDVVFAIGDPFGVGQTVTQGIISALNKNHVGINQYENFIQTDASINPGNSGGALIDSRGALIGINSAILSKSGGNNGIGFSIPIDMVQNVVSKLIKNGKVTRGFIGVNISKVTKELKNVYNHQKGAIVTDIQPNSPAQKAQLQRGDLIYAVNGKTIKGPYDLQRLVSSHNPNEEITLSLERDKQKITKKLTLMGNTSYSSNTVVEGLHLSQLTNQLKETYQIPSNVKGVLIEDVEVQSSAYQSGFRPGDVLIQVENMSIETIQQAKEAFNAYKGRTKRVYINRGGYIILLVTQ